MKKEQELADKLEAYKASLSKEEIKALVAEYYHQFKENLPFFIDYTFSNLPLKSYKLGEWDKSISDHVSQFIEI